MALNNLQNGYQLIDGTSDSFSIADIEGYSLKTIYFVRTNSDNNDGYIHFNGKDYGTSKDTKQELTSKLGTLPEGYDDFVSFVNKSVEEKIRDVSDRGYLTIDSPELLQLIQNVVQQFVPDITITECTSLSITANNVKWDETTTTINYTATVNGIDRFGNNITGDIITGTTVSEKFEENQSDETVERVISFKYFGVTATTTIIQSYNLKHLGFTAISDSQFKFTKNGDGDDIRYSIDNGITWTALPIGELTPLIKAGESIFWKSTITPGTNGIGTFSSSDKFNVYGNIMSLLYDDDFVGQTSLEGKNFAFYNLFKNCSFLIDASNLILPATTLANTCYKYMFNDCTSLTTAPSILPATTLANYCYEAMFNGCTSLTTAPSILSATKLANSCCVDMFRGCTSLTTAPELPAMTLADRCYYYMFQGCTSLTTAPELPATALAENCYQYMFRGCTSLTTAPELPATTLVKYCYSYMFKGCTSLNHITMLATGISATSCLRNWVSDVASTGTFVKHPDMTSLPTGSNGIPNGWTVEDYQG